MDRNVSMVTLTILLLSVFIGFNFIYGPKMNALRQLEALQREEREKKILSDEIGRLEKEILTYQKHWVPRGKEEAELLNYVRDIAGESQVHVMALVPRVKQELHEGGYRKFPISVTFGGSYHHLGDFISKVETAGLFIKIDTLEFLTNVQREGRAPLQCDITLSVFSIP